MKGPIVLLSSLRVAVEPGLQVGLGETLALQECALSAGGEHLEGYLSKAHI